VNLCFNNVLNSDEFSIRKNINFSAEGNVPMFFYIIRPSFRPPCVVIRLAFLGGLDGLIRHQVD